MSQQLIAILMIGLGIGWLAGLSVSPVVGTVLASLLGVAGGIVAAARSLPAEASAASFLSGVDARPAAVLVLGIALGVAGLSSVKGFKEFYGDSMVVDSAIGDVPTLVTSSDHAE